MRSLSATPTVVPWLLGAVAVVWVALELRQSTKHRAEAVRAGWRSEVVFRLLVAAGGASAVLLARADPGARIRPPAVAAWIGIVAFLCGSALRIWSFHALGRYFTLVVQTSADQPVITAGPYRVIRHPSYAGVLLLVVAIGLLVGNPWSFLAVIVAVTAAVVFRIRVEERALFTDLGDEYQAYAATHKRLVPGIW